ncbi:hypothetical protein BCR33DRAFT_825963 [Rhizoclosmatium globosum]|uniref:Uncharacterized protein n=1 Tax=Rhizoclosmatium globosum TaxID=329046 RepID=A0A1Y2C4F3_9FUNG|nr:hypothetical protein BCR33DRAFT_825963 [Rhizoclosmatium globosum]|eukprot:ORY41195.1 hypothetical protein BCR33DRAFT_825963 [Rhizoclosmatium globosum]
MGYNYTAIIIEKTTPHWSNQVWSDFWIRFNVEENVASTGGSIVAAPPADTPQAQVPTKSNQPGQEAAGSFYALGLSESGTRFRLVEMEGQEAIAQETTLAALDALLLDSDRLLFAATGKLFSPSSPLPFGGPRTKPGYVNYRGSTTQDLKRYIVSEMYRLYSITRCRKLLKYVATCFHCVLDYQQDGRKDDLDELMLKGMPTTIPPPL